MFQTCMTREKHCPPVSTHKPHGMTCRVKQTTLKKTVLFTVNGSFHAWSKDVFV